MLIGAHVSPAGGPAKAIERGEALGARSIQIFNQNPRAWKPTIYSDEQVEEFREAMAQSDVDALLIHAVYLLNAASEDPDIRAKTLTSLTASLNAGEALGATAVVLHPGSAKGGDVGQAIVESEGCSLHLENTAGAGGTLGRSFDELGALIEAAGGDDRLGICLDSCHMLASGIEIRDQSSLTAAINDCIAATGKGRIGSLHCNDSMMEFGSNRDRHADLGAGELGADGCAVFLSEPRFAELPCVLETPGPEKKGPTKKQVAEAVALRERGLSERA